MTPIDSAPGIETTVVRGWDVLTLTSPELRLQLVPGLGASVVSLCRVSDGVELLHRTPWGLPNPATPGLAGSAIERRYDLDPGGWQPLFPNAGDNAIVDGIEWGTDGEARIAPFDLSTDLSTGEGEATGEVTPVTATMSTRLRRTPFRITRTVTLTGTEVRLRETIEHVGRSPLRVMWANRLAFAAPLVGPGAQIDCGAAVVHPDAGLLYDVDYADISPWPRTPGPDSMINLRYLPEPGSEERRMAYLAEFETGWLTITNADLGCRVRLEWDLEAWPQLWYELEDGGTTEHPWFGTERFLALTPSSSWPARGVHDARRIADSALELEPGDERTAELTLRVESLS